MRILSIAFAVTITFVSCEIDTEINIQPPHFVAQPVVICFASPGQQTIGFVGQTTPLNEQPVIEPEVTVLSFRVMQNDQIVGLLQPALAPGLYQSAGILAFEANKPYYVEVETLNFGLVKSEVVYLPNLTPIDTLFLKDSTENLAGIFTVAAIFSDNSLQHNFYASKSRYFNGDDELVDSSANYVHLPSFVFDDVDFNGTARLYESKVPKKIFNTQAQSVKMAKLTLFSLSQALFTFLSSINQNEGSFSDVITEPVPVTSNIIQGHGVFGLYQSDTLQIHF